MTAKLAIATEASGNRKTGPVHATYSARQSCGKCPLKNAGCYAGSGRVAIHWDRISDDAATVEAIARAEAKAIDTLSGRFDARIHVAGDCSTPEAAAIVGEAVDHLAERQALYTRRDGKARRAWTYTHSWDEIPRDAWGESLSVMASIHAHEDGETAIAQGYAPALTVETLPERAYKRDGIIWIPCAEQQHGTPCVDCRACFDGDRLARKRLGILFAIHGPKRKAREALNI
jgi:hypothetical protein